MFSCLLLFIPSSLDSHQVRDGRHEHHQLLISVEEQTQTGDVTVLLIRQLPLLQILRHDRLHLQAHVVRQEWEEVMLHVAVDEGMAEGPV